MASDAQYIGNLFERLPPLIGSAVSFAVVAVLMVSVSVRLGLSRSLAEAAPSKQTFSNEIDGGTVALVRECQSRQPLRRRPSGLQLTDNGSGDAKPPPIEPAGQPAQRTLGLRSRGETGLEPIDESADIAVEQNRSL